MDIARMQLDPPAFRAGLKVDTANGPQPWKLDPWQDADFRALDPGWRRAAGQVVDGDVRQRGWLERGRGHSKSSDVMTMASWCLFASRKRLSGIVAAVDRDQAGLDRDAVGRLVANNPWLGQFIEVQQWRVVNKHTGSTLEIMSSDVASSYGLLLDFAVCDEVSVWSKRDLFDSILSAAAKRSTCLLLCIGNAGYRESWQWGVREAIRTDPGWYFSRQEGPVASWISQKDLAEQRRLLPSAAYDRLWANLWTSGAGDAIAPDILEAAFKSGIGPQSMAEEEYDYVAGVDAGVSRDASALCVLGVRRSHEGHGKIRLAATRVWRPTPGNKVDLQAVEDALVDSHTRFRLRQINYDPWEMRYLASRLQAGGLGHMARGSERRGLPMVECPPTGQVLQKIATCMVEAFNDRRLELYENAELRRDLQRMRVEERSYGFRITAPRDATGHGDLGTAFSLALLAASELAARPVRKMSVSGGAMTLGGRTDRFRKMINSNPGMKQAFRDGTLRWADEMM